MRYCADVLIFYGYGYDYAEFACSSRPLSSIIDLATHRPSVDFL